MDGDTGGNGLAAFALDRFAVARIERCEKFVECRKALVVPVKLLVGPLQKAVFSKEFRFRFAREGDMDR